MQEPRPRPRVVIIGAGFAGYAAARELGRLAGRSADITVISATDYLGCTPAVTARRCPT
jgi:NADH:ubiquinone reductase (H+-translocating)